LCAALNLQAYVFIERDVHSFEPVSDGFCAAVDCGDLQVNLQFGGRRVIAGISEVSVEHIECVVTPAQPGRLAERRVRFDIGDELVQIAGLHSRPQEPFGENLCADTA